MRDQDVTLYDYPRLRAEFGAFTETPDGQIPARTEHDLVGERYRHVLGELSRIVSYQWRRELSHSALKGFLFHGGVGLGKTTMARRVTYELCRLFGDLGPGEERSDEIVLVLIDGADIARGRYGESEEQLRSLFEYARSGESAGHRHEPRARRRTVLLFDDVESLLLTRSSAGAKEWHFSQNSVFFHSVDELDTSRTVVILTTNRLDLLDAAIVDRFLPYEFGVPSPDVLEAVAREKGQLQGLDESALQPVLERLRADSAEQVRSIREVERLVMHAFIQQALA